MQMETHTNRNEEKQTNAYKFYSCICAYCFFFFLLFFAEEQTFKETAFAKKQKKNKLSDGSDDLYTCWRLCFNKL